MLEPLIDSDPRAIGPYRLSGRLGTGGMGAVYLGFDPARRPAAVKVVRPDLLGDAEFRGRFRQEVAAARRVRGSFVAAVLDADVDAPTPWMATEYVDGVSLQTAVGRRGRLDGPMLAGLAAGLANALVAVHAAGLVHRDLKPSNVLLAWDGPKIIDFGIARALDATSHTTAGGVLGTVAWMAPEQLRGERVGPPGDIFAWALCVVFAARGRHPFPADAPAVSALRMLADDPDLTGVPDHLLPLLAGALAKDPGLRPTATQVVSSLAGVAVTSLDEADAAARGLIGTGWVPPTPPGAGPPPDVSGVRTLAAPSPVIGAPPPPAVSSPPAAGSVSTTGSPATAGRAGGGAAGARRSGLLTGLAAAGLVLAVLAVTLAVTGVGRDRSAASGDGTGQDARMQVGALKDMAPPAPAGKGARASRPGLPATGPAGPGPASTAPDSPGAAPDGTPGPGGPSPSAGTPGAPAPTAPAPAPAPSQAPRLPPATPLYRYYNGQDHATLTSATPAAGFHLEQVLGNLFTSGDVPGTVPVYTCLDGSESFTSLASSCESRTPVGVLGWIYAAKPAEPATLAVYRCRIGADHFDSPRADCEGQTAEGLIGYAPP
ncbi:protein kinase domain-containing protein [Parafrankia discariae]|uniref:protein kinase domain-containing protein n=1 Tax=Parafrankia discariae TaxID=365528 RepID=UPI0003A27047|nr:serine/threonine-protein kinase [Parafrankia discariae]